MQRRAMVFLVRIVFIMFVLQVLSLAVYSLSVEDMGDRLSYTSTMLLTAVAYTLVIAGSLPELGYLTFLDQYVRDDF